MIVGVGIDVVPVERFAGALARTPTLVGRLFTANERITDSGGARSAESLAARFAAKEALAKALGAPGGMRWTDAEIVADEAGRPHRRRHRDGRRASRRPRRAALARVVVTRRRHRVGHRDRRGRLRCTASGPSSKSGRPSPL